MSSEQSESVETPKNFVIEDNIIKGTENSLDSDVGVTEFILKILNDHSENIGQIDAHTEEQITYGEMKEKIIRCALWMQKHEIGPGDVVAICTNNQMDTYIPCFATFLVGAIYNPWHHEVPLRLACYLMNLTRPKAVFACESAVYTTQIAACIEDVEASFVVFGNYLEVISLEDALNEQSNEEVENFEPKFIDDLRNTISMIVFSSGTTGLPKGVAHSYEMLYRSIFKPLFPPQIRIFLCYSSIYWISGTIFMLQTMMSGGIKIVHSNSDPEEACKVIQKFQVNFLFMSPSSMTHFSKSKVFKKYAAESLIIVMAGGAKLNPELILEFKKTIPHTFYIQGYGMSECGIATLQSKECKIIDSIGFIKSDYQFKVVDVDSGEVLGSNQQGELHIKSSLMMIGYYRNPVATRESIDEEGWLHTGDIVYYTDYGEIVVVDRIKEIMKFRGHHVSPTELEEVLMRHPAVMEVGVVPIPHEMDLERPMAFVKKVPGVEVTEEELVEMTSELGEYKKLWGGVKFLEEMPHTASEKINKKDLKEMAKALYHSSNSK